MSDPAGPAAGGPLVDCHTHVFTADMPVAGGAWIRPEYGFTAADLTAAMDAHGVHFSVVSGLSISGFYNDYMIAELRANRRLRGTAIVPPTVDRYTLERMQADGIVGIRLQLARRDSFEDFRGDDYRLLLRRVRDLGWHVQVAIEGRLLPPVLAALLESGANLVIDHFGHPDPADPLNCPGFRAMVEAADTGRCWIKLSGGFRLAGPAAWQDPEADLEQTARTVAEALLARVGTDRLLWGSDAPFVGYEKRLAYPDVLRTYRAWVPDAARRAEIDRTALKLFFG
jgi:predicted TIM-barrel fold metal-dependent hydrolase